MRDRLTGRWPALRDRRWAIAAPVALIGAIAIAALWLDVATGGEAEPPPLLGELGTPVRGTFIPPTATPPGAAGTPRPRPTVEGSIPGTPAERDAQRRADVATISNALLALRDRDGSFPTTHDNIQSLCAYKEVDVGCVVREILGAEPPQDPLGEPLVNGYWYSSNGETARVYASLEGGIDDSERCDTDYVDFEDDENLICPQIP